MDHGNMKDLVIAGSGSTGGGSFRNIRIDGFGKITGDVDFEQFQTNGKSEVLGCARGTHIDIHGSSKLNGHVEAKLFHIQGEAHIDGDVSYRELTCKGKAAVKGSARGESLDLEGGLNVDGDCEAEKFIVSGGFQIGGLLNADAIDITLYWSCKAQEIGGEKITVRKGSKSSIWNPFLPKIASRHLTADTIEGDEIDLEHTTARIVRGNRVTLGPGCSVNLVEYKQHFEADKGAKVNESKQI